MLKTLSLTTVLVVALLLLCSVPAIAEETWCIGRLQPVDKGGGTATGQQFVVQFHTLKGLSPGEDARIFFRGTPVSRIYFTFHGWNGAARAYEWGVSTTWAFMRWSEWSISSYWQIRYRCHRP
jgi:hypothetical protein